MTFPRIKLHNKMLPGLVFGAIFGVLFNVSKHELEIDRMYRAVSGVSGDAEAGVIMAKQEDILKTIDPETV